MSGGITAPTYDNRGNLTAYNGQTFGYDTYNRLTSVGGTGGSMTLDYDPMGRLWETSGASGTARYQYDGAALIAQYSTTGAMQHRWVHGPGMDEPLVRYDGSGTTNKRWLHADERGSIIAHTDVTGARIQTNTYDAYGIPGALNDGLFQYTGQIWLEDAGIYHYKARAYHAELGVFMQTDPTGHSGGINLYAYVGGDPVNFTDPWGLFAWADDDCDKKPEQPKCRDVITVTGTRPDPSECPWGAICNADEIRNFLKTGRFDRLIGSEGLFPEADGGIGGDGAGQNDAATESILGICFVMRSSASVGDQIGAGVGVDGAAEISGNIDGGSYHLQSGSVISGAWPFVRTEYRVAFTRGATASASFTPWLSSDIGAQQVIIGPENIRQALEEDLLLRQVPLEASTSQFVGVSASARFFFGIAAQLGVEPVNSDGSCNAF